MKKPVSKRTPKSISLQLSTDEPWDTMKAQILVKIDTVLKPKTLDFPDYTVMFYILRNLPKPGMNLCSEDDHNRLLQRARNLNTKTPTIHLTITENTKDDVNENKENEDEDEEDEPAPKAKKKVRTRCICIVHIPSINLTLDIVAIGQEGPCYASWQRQQEQQCAASSRTMEVPETAGDLCRCLLLPQPRYWCPYTAQP